jgi:type IV pilus assembly protein PilN
MPRINLLPWRAELRSERQKNFVISAVVAVLLAAAVTWNVNFYMQGRIDYQNERNQRLETEIARLDMLIEEIANLERQKDRLLARMEIIEELQRSRPDSVHLFDDLVRILPEGAYYTGIKQVDRRVDISGIAESNARVSALMKSIERVEWLEEPGLKVIEAITRNETRRSEFTVSAKQLDTSTGEEEL